MADKNKMGGYCSTGQSPQWAVVPMEEEEEEDDEDDDDDDDDSFTMYTIIQSFITATCFGI